MQKAFSVILLTAAMYYVAGKLALLLAIPPGYATAVWPASGLALAAVLLWGYRVWPGILLGSFLVNVSTSFDANTQNAAITSVLVAASIGSGAALQACMAGWLIRRFVGYENILTQSHVAIRLLLVGGPLGCIINASIGVTTLWATGLVPGDNYLFNWWTWWVGDSIGVLIFTPMLLVWALRPLRVWFRQQLLVTIPMLIMFVAVIFLFVLASTRESAGIQTEFEKWSERFSYELRSNLQVYRAILAATRGLYESSVHVERDEFEAFANRLMTYGPELLALSWNAHVVDEDRAAYIARTRQATFEDYEIYEIGTDGQRKIASQRKEYFPVHVAIPLGTNQRALGYDIASEPVRREALHRALATGQGSATGPINLVQLDRDRRGLLLLSPTYRGADQQGELLGIAVVSIRISDLMRPAQNILKGTGLQVVAYDVSDNSKPQFLYSSLGESEPIFSPEGLSKSVQIDVAGRLWRIDYHLSSDYLVAHRSWEAWTLLTAGLLFTALLGIFLILEVGRSAQIESIVQDRTAELNAANNELKAQVDVSNSLQQEADQRLVQLEDKHKELERFSYVVSHDLQAPLRGVSGFAELLNKRYSSQLDDEGREYLQFITQGAVQMHRMIGDILQLSRIGTSEIKPQAIALGEVVERVRVILQMDLKSLGAELTWQGLPTVQADDAQMTQLFQNLIGNAIKFCAPDRPPKVRISAEKSAEGWHIQVADNGIGISKDKQDRLFGLFVRLHTAEEYPGTGLGLAICKRIVERHGGRIWLESEKGQGTTFHIILPGD